MKPAREDEQVRLVVDREQSFAIQREVNSFMAKEAAHQLAQT